MKKLLAFIKKETVLCAAWVLAVLSACFIPPGTDYIDYIDFKSLGTLWSLMIIVAGLNAEGVFAAIARRLLQHVSRVWQLCLVLVLLPFFASMLITNDVSLITFVPFAIYILKISQKEDLLIPVVILQTLAANLGSMLTPIGNPQNLYLYGISDMGMGEFLLLMLPYSALSLALLLICIFCLKGKSDVIASVTTENEKSDRSRLRLALYLSLFVFALVCVTFSRVISYGLLPILVLACVLLADRSRLVKIDYALLFTFVGFFLFTGNLKNIEAVRTFMTSMVAGHETLCGILVSQAISNVPAALLLAGFSEDLSALIVGVNLGGLGTLIASMASLISYKLLAHDYNEKKGPYFLWFTLANVVFLSLLAGLALLLA